MLIVGVRHRLAACRWARIKTRDVFISCKHPGENGQVTRDASLARDVYEFLSARGLKVFLSSVSLEKLGASEYTRVIDDALDGTRVLIAVGTSAENLDSHWVRYEWDSFANDVRSGRKPGWAHPHVLRR